MAQRPALLARERANASTMPCDSPKRQKALCGLPGGFSVDGD